MRCLALAEGLREIGVRSHFVCRTHSRDLGDRVVDAGHGLSLLPALASECDEDDSGAWLGLPWERDAADTIEALGSRAALEWLVVDHYGIDARWERRMATHARRIMAIDDLADREHHCDVLLDSGIDRQAPHYAGLIASTTVTLLGPDYGLLRRAFAEQREASLQRRRASPLRRILVSLGGADSENVTERVLDGLDNCTLAPDSEIIVVAGPLSPWRARLEDRAGRMRHRCQVRVDVRDMAGLMLESDLAIGAGGGSALERCVMGLPSVVVVLAENQRRGADALRRRGAAALIESASAIGDRLPGLIDTLSQPEALRAQSQRASEVIDGRGVERVVERMRDRPR
jgi:UDP-2,4-diacetamido-2,4,6-trideoxy-beta-L-altropyranose hydrolase